MPRDGKRILSNLLALPLRLAQVSRTRFLKIHFAFHAPKQILRLWWRYWRKKGSALIWKTARAAYAGQKKGVLPADIEIRVISLESREDRRTRIKAHFSDLGLDYLFSPGVEHEIGEVGCAEAHVRLLRNWDPRAGQILVVCEDDLLFMEGRGRVMALIREFENNEGIDVLCLGHNSVGPFVKVSASLSLTSDTQTTSCYVLKPSAVPLILKSFECSLEMLLAGGAGNKWTIDVLWKKLQRESMVFAIPQVQIARQVASFSDVQNRWVDYQT